MEAMRTDWSDKRLDDLKQSVDDGFKEVKGSVDRVDSRVDGLHERLAELNRTMAIGFVSLAGVVVAYFGALATLFGRH